jgi:hypothetical protein
MAGPVDNLSFVARRLIQYERRFSQAHPARKSEAAALFLRIASSIQSLVDHLERDQLPHEPCRELILSSTRLKECAEEELGPAEAEKLANMLGEASDKERIYLQYRSDVDKKSLGEELQKAAILIRALANGLCPVPPGHTGGVDSALG